MKFATAKTCSQTFTMWADLFGEEVNEIAVH